MRAIGRVVGLSALLVGLDFVVEPPPSARAAEPAWAECKRLALEKRALDKAGMRAYLEKSPETVVAERGRPFLEQVRHYIALSETVLFKCPRNVLNATAAASREQSGVIPPLPVKGPFKARARPPRPPFVPLPVQRQAG